MKIILATQNMGKIKEFANLLSPLNAEIVPQTAFSVEEVEETGLSFVENALIKARHAAIKSKLPSIADDSGLVVPALHGAPGIYSARYAGSKSSAKDNIQKLLLEMQSLSGEKRHAYFYCALVYLAYPSDPAPYLCTATWHGYILHEARGTAGFGYDPIFYLSERGETAAELPLTIKNKISHRALAAQALLTMLRKTL